MPTVDEVFAGKTLKAADFDQPRLCTIEHVDVREFKDKGGVVTRKFVISLVGEDKEFVCNKTNAKMIAKYYGQDSEDWHGKKIVLYKADVEYAGDIVEGIRVRMPKAGGAAAPAVKQPIHPIHPPAGKYNELDPPPLGELDDDIPF